MTRQQMDQQIDDIRDLVSEAMNAHTDMRLAQNAGTAIGMADDVGRARNRLNACRDEITVKLYKLAGLA